MRSSQREQGRVGCWHHPGRGEAEQIRSGFTLPPAARQRDNPGRRGSRCRSSPGGELVSTRTARRLAIALTILYVVLEVAGLAFQFATGAYRERCRRVTGQGGLRFRLPRLVGHRSGDRVPAPRQRDRMGAVGDRARVGDRRPDVRVRDLRDRLAPRLAPRRGVRGRHLEQRLLHRRASPRAVVPPLPRRSRPLPSMAGHRMGGLDRLRSHVLRELRHRGAGGRVSACRTRMRSCRRQRFSDGWRSSCCSGRSSLP